MADANTIGRIGGILKTTFGPKIEEQQNKMAVLRTRYGKADNAYFRAPGSQCLSLTLASAVTALVLHLRPLTTLCPPQPASRKSSSSSRIAATTPLSRCTKRTC